MEDEGELPVPVVNTDVLEVAELAQGIWTDTVTVDAAQVCD